MLKYNVVLDGVYAFQSMFKRDAIKIRSFLITFISRSRRRCIFYKSNDFSLQTSRNVRKLNFISFVIFHILK